MHSGNPAYFRILGAVIAMIVVAGVGRWSTNAAAKELALHRSPGSQVALDALARFVKPVAPAPPLALIEPIVPQASEDDELPFEGLADGIEPAAAVKPRWTVSAILITDARRVAVVNEALVTVGSTVPGGARVLAIEPDHVVLQEPGGARRVIRIAAN